MTTTLILLGLAALLTIAIYVANKAEKVEPLPYEDAYNEAYDNYDAAYDLFAENIIGSLEVGKQADLVVLEKSPRKTAPAEIRNIKVKETWIDGKHVNWE